MHAWAGLRDSVRVYEIRTLAEACAARVMTDADRAAVAVSEQQARAELTRVNREIRRLRTELAELEERRAKLGSDLAE